jgi:polyhydroxybutyrate depolymerase
MSVSRLYPVFTIACVIAAVSVFAASALAGPLGKLRQKGAENDQHYTLTHDGQERLYILHALPAPAARKRPAVLVLHGGGGSAENAVRMFGFSKVAMPDGAIIAYPEGSGRFEGKLKTWNAGHCCGYAMENKVDDIGFISALIDRLIAEHNADPRRIYITGMSNGGMMTHRLGIALADKVAAIAPVVGGLFGDEAAPAAAGVSVLAINGALDQSVPLDGGLGTGRGAAAWDGTPLKPAAYQGEFWAAANGCSGTPQETQEGNVKTARYKCSSGVEVVHMVALDDGHTWPGGKPGTKRGDVSPGSLEASQVIWDFFKGKSR